MFGAIGGVNDNRKGFKLLKNALQNLEKLTDTHNIDLVIFGGGNNIDCTELNYKIHKFNLIDNDRILQRLYCAADLMIVPSKMEAFGLSALEAMSCGTPVVGFENTGLGDIIDHKKTGYLAKYLDENDFVQGINWLINNSSKEIIDVNCRKRVEIFFQMR